MANQPHPDRKAITWRLHRDLVAAVQAAAAEHGETILAFATRALTRELDHDAELDGGAAGNPRVKEIGTAVLGIRCEGDQAWIDVCDDDGVHSVALDPRDAILTGQALLDHGRRCSGVSAAQC